MGFEEISHCEPFYIMNKNCHISCYNTKNGKPEWHIDFKKELKDSFSSVAFFTEIVEVFKLNEEEVGIIYKRSHTDALLTETLPTLLIVDKKGNVKQKISPRMDSIGGIIIHQKDGAIRFASKNQNQYLIKGKIEEDSKYYWMNYFQNEW